jgi:hypothetical protein
MRLLTASQAGINQIRVFDGRGTATLPCIDPFCFAQQQRYDIAVKSEGKERINARRLKDHFSHTVTFRRNRGFCR